jgi:hypothetical protein
MRRTGADSFDVITQRNADHPKFSLFVIIHIAACFHGARVRHVKLHDDW